MARHSDTHVFRESISWNLSWTISIPHKHFRGRTMTMFLRDVIHEHGCGFPKNPEGQATFECLEAVYHLQSRISRRSVMSVTGNNSRCGLFIWLVMSCIISTTQSDILISYSRQQGIPRAFWIPSADALPSRRKKCQTMSEGQAKAAFCLTINDYPHILDETVDHLESLCCGCTSLILGQSV